MTVSPFGDIWSEEGRHGRGKPRVMYQSCQQCVWILESGNLDSNMNSMSALVFPSPQEHARGLQLHLSTFFWSIEHVMFKKHSRTC